MISDAEEPARGRRELCVALCLLLASIAFLGGVVAYVVFTVIFLVKDRDACGGTSPVWTYVVMSMIFSIIMSRTKHQSNEEEEMQQPTLFRRLAYAVAAPMFNVVYGSLVIHSGTVCDEMKHTGLWIIAQIIYYTSVAVTGILFLLMILLLMKPPPARAQNDTHREVEEINVQLTRIQELLQVAQARSTGNLPQAQATTVLPGPAPPTAVATAVASESELADIEITEATVVTAV